MKERAKKGRFEYSGLHELGLQGLLGDSPVEAICISTVRGL